MQILGGLSADLHPTWGHGSTLSSLMTPPPPPLISTTTSPVGLPPFISPSSSSSGSTVSPTLVRLCSLWPYIHSSPAPSPPDICKSLPTTYLIDHRDIFRDSGLYHHGLGPPRRNVAGPGERMVGIDAVQELTFSGRSFSLMGVLGGVLFILLVIAFITCIRHRKRVRNEADGELDLDVISSRIRRIHQARAGHHLLSVLSSMPDTPPAPPPDYDAVLKLREKEESDLPSYLEAIRESEELHNTTCYPNNGSTAQPTTSSNQLLSTPQDVCLDLPAYSDLKLEDVGQLEEESQHQQSSEPSWTGQTIAHV